MATSTPDHDPTDPTVERGEVTSALDEKGPKEAMEKLVAFLEKLPK